MAKLNLNKKTGDTLLAYEVNKIGASVDNLYDHITEYNVSKLHPTGGIGGTNKYTLDLAIKKIPAEYQSVGIKCSFLTSESKPQVYLWTGGTFNDATTWQKFGEVTAKEALFIDMWNEACGVYGKYNTQTGYYELNGLTDISYAEALMIYDAKSDRIIKNQPCFAELSQRTALAPQSIASSLCEIAVDSDVIVLNLIQRKEFWIRPGITNNCSRAFYKCRNLKNLMTTLWFFDGIKKEDVVSIFSGCAKLREVRLKNVSFDISLKDSPELSYDSVKYMIDNAQILSAPATILVHADVYAKLSNSGNVEWHKVFTDAQTKNISFATA